jgi:hypothetical protein
MDLYADKVNYFRAGWVTKDFIYRDKKKYYKRWPSMQMTFLGIVNIVNVGNHHNQKKVTYKIGFDVYNYKKKKGIKGEAINTFIVQKTARGLQIVSDKQEVLYRKRYFY